MDLYEKKKQQHWILIHQLMQLIFKNLQMKPVDFLLRILDDSIQKSFKIIFLYMITSARTLYESFRNPLCLNMVGKDIGLVEMEKL